MSQKTSLIKYGECRLFTQSPCWLLAFTYTLLAITFYSSAQATIIFDNFDADGGFNSQNSNIIVAKTASSDIVIIGESGLFAHRSAVQFTVTSGNFLLHSISLPIAFDGSLNNTLRVRLVKDNKGAPGNTLETLADTQNTWPIYSSTAALKQITTLVSTVKPLLVEGSKYWVVAEVTSFAALFGSLEYYWYTNTSGATVPYNIQRADIDNTSTDPWLGATISSSETSNLNLAFSIDATPIGNAFVMCASNPETTENHQIDTFLLGDEEHGTLLGEYDTTDKLACGEDIYLRGTYTRVSTTRWHFFFATTEGNSDNCSTYLYDGIWENTQANAGAIFYDNGNASDSMSLFLGPCSTVAEPPTP